MSRDEHFIRLGKLVANYQSLEFLLRVVLQSLPSARPLGIPHGVDVYSFPVGSKLPESEITSYDSLGQLISKYNKEMARRQLPLIDNTLVAVRDALAHGRVSAPTLNGTLRLLKFGERTNGLVPVAFNVEMSARWFSSQTRRVYDAIRFVTDNARTLQLDVAEILI